MPILGMLSNIIHMDLENQLPVQIKPKGRSQNECLCTSEKVRLLLAKFPPSQPKSDLTTLGYSYNYSCGKCMSTNCKSDSKPIPLFPNNLENETRNEHPRNDTDTIQSLPSNEKNSRVWDAVIEVVQLLQLVVTATAFALYYIIYGWMQFVYHGLRVAMYFRDSDGPMKITLGVVAVTSIVVAFNMLLRIRKIYIDILR